MSYYVTAPSLHHININAGTELSYLSAAAKHFHISLGAVMPAAASRLEQSVVGHAALLGRTAAGTNDNSNWKQEKAFYCNFREREKLFFLNIRGSNRFTVR
jgi:hypothetical protein